MRSGFHLFILHAFVHLKQKQNHTEPLLCARQCSRLGVYISEQNRQTISKIHITRGSDGSGKAFLRRGLLSGDLKEVRDWRISGGRVFPWEGTAGEKGPKAGLSLVGSRNSEEVRVRGESRR